MIKLIKNLVILCFYLMIIQNYAQAYELEFVGIVPDSGLITDAPLKITTIVIKGKLMPPKNEDDDHWCKGSKGKCAEASHETSGNDVKRKVTITFFSEDGEVVKEVLVNSYQLEESEDENGELITTFIYDQDSDQD